MLGDLILILIEFLKTIKKYTKRFFCVHSYDNDCFPVCKKCLKHYKSWF